MVLFGSSKAFDATSVLTRRSKDSLLVPLDASTAWGLHGRTARIADQGIIFQQLGGIKAVRFAHEVGVCPWMY